MNQRKKKGDVEGFEAGLNHWLKFKIWKVERELEEEQAKAAKTSNKMRNAHKCKQRERLDKSNIENKWRKAKKKNKKVERRKIMNTLKIWSLTLKLRPPVTQKRKGRTQGKL